MDIQFVLDPYACCSYIVDYINKADRGIIEALDQVYAQCREDNNTTAFDVLKSLAATHYNASKISAQEAVYNILGLRMVEFSVGTVFVPTSKADDRVQILKAQRELQLLPFESTKIFVPGLLDHYVNRPNELKHITLAQFVAYYKYSKIRPGASSFDRAAEAEDVNETEDKAPTSDGDNAAAEEERNAPVTAQDVPVRNNVAAAADGVPEVASATNPDEANPSTVVLVLHLKTLLLMSLPQIIYDIQGHQQKFLIYCNICNEIATQSPISLEGECPPNGTH